MTNSDAPLYKRLLTALPARTDHGLLLLRVSFGLGLAALHGLPKVLGFSGFVEKVEAQGFPLPALSAGFAAGSEFFGGILLALGLWTRAAGVSIALTLACAAFWVHASDPISKKEFALTYAIVGLVCALTGPGRFSLDARASRS